MPFVLLVILLTSAVVFYMLWYYSPREKIKRALRDATKYSIRDFPDSSLGKVVGRLVLLDEQLVAPLSGRPCAYFSISVEEYRSRGKSGSWVTMVEEERGVDFALDDGSGTAIVVVASAKTALSSDHRSSSGTFDDPTPREQSYLDSHGRESEGWVFNKKIRYIEAVLEPGELVSVYGYGSKEPDPKATPGGYREMQPMRLRISGSQNHPPLISDELVTT